MACLKGLAFTSDGKIKDNGVRRAILDNLHTVMCMPIELNESIETFMTCGRNKIKLPSASWTRHFWTYYFQVGTWINSQYIIVVPPCCAYPKIFTPWINVKTQMMDLTIPCGYCVSCYKFVNGGASTSATFKPGHTSIDWILPWGIETIVLFGNKRASRLVDWLVSVETQNNKFKTLHAHGQNEKT